MPETRSTSCARSSRFSAASSLRELRKSDATQQTTRAEWMSVRRAHHSAFCLVGLGFSCLPACPPVRLKALCSVLMRKNLLAGVDRGRCTEKAAASDGVRSRGADTERHLLWVASGRHLCPGQLFFFCRTRGTSLLGIAHNALDQAPENKAAQKNHNAGARMHLSLIHISEPTRPY